MAIQVRLVEAIEEGKIVTVPEEYAKREGLLILRKQQEYLDYTSTPSRETKIEKEVINNRKVMSLDKLRKPLKYYQNNVISELVDNFHWEIVRARRVKNISRRQLAQSIGEKDETLTNIENGLLPADNFIIINKIQNYLGINLRKDGKNFNAVQLPRDVKKVEKKEENKEPAKNEDIDVSGIDLEIFED